MRNKAEFQTKLGELINYCSIDAQANTPDFALAGMLADILEGYIDTKTVADGYLIPSGSPKLFPLSAVPERVEMRITSAPGGEWKCECGNNVLIGYPDRNVFFCKECERKYQA